MSYTEFNPEAAFYDPYDSVDWRWRRVRQLASDPSKKPGKDDDRFVVRGYRFLTDLRACESEVDFYSVSADHPLASRAYSWYNHKGSKRYFLEAMCLCDDIDDDVRSEYMGSSPDAIEMFTRLFFDIHKHIGDEGYLTTKVLEPAMLATINDGKDPNIMWKLVAIFGGFEVLKSCWEYKDPGHMVNAFHTSVGKAQMAKNFGMANYARPINRFNTTEIVNDMLRLLEMHLREKAMGQFGEEADLRAEMLRGLLSSVQLSVTEPSAPRPQLTTEGYIEEPRLNDLIRSN